MKKKFKQALLLSFLISLSLGKVSNAQELDIFVNRAKIDMDSSPYISQTQRTMVPVSFISNALNLKTIWREDSQSVLIVKDEKEIIIPIGNTHAFINGKPVDMDIGKETVAEIKNSRTMVPISFIATSFGLDVSFIEGINGLNHSILISGEQRIDAEKKEKEKEKEKEIEKEKKIEKEEIERIEIEAETENKRKIEETLINNSKKPEPIKSISGKYPNVDELQEAIESHLENNIYSFELNLRNFNINSKEPDYKPFDSFQEFLNKSMENIVDYDWRKINTLLKYSKDSAKLEVNIEMSMNKKEERFVNEWVSEKIREFSSDKQGLELEREKLKYVTDLLAREIEYDQSMTKSTEYMGLTGGTTTCNGYARLSKRFFDGFGIENILIIGDANGPHIWNKVKYNGRWLHIDNTWNDPIINENIGKDKNHVIYDFFLKDDAFMSRTHDF